MSKENSETTGTLVALLALSLGAISYLSNQLLELDSVVSSEIRRAQYRWGTELRADIIAAGVPDPVGLLLAIAYVPILFGALQRSDSYKLRRCIMAGNLVFGLAGWLGAIWPMVVANASILLINGVVVFSTMRRKRREKMAKAVRPVRWGLLSRFSLPAGSILRSLAPPNTASVFRRRRRGKTTPIRSNYPGRVFDVGQAFREPGVQ